MLELWIPITIFAAFCQNVRSALQKHMSAGAGTFGATFARFGFGAPVACLYVAFLHLVLELPFPATSASFFVYGVLGGLAQIAATALLVYLFSLRNFAVGTAYSKTEPVQAAIFAMVILGEAISFQAGIFILLGVLGVIVISRGKKKGESQGPIAALTSKPAWIGLSSAALFGGSAALYRAASLSLTETTFLMQAGFALACVTVFQTLLMVAVMAWKVPDQLIATCKGWRISALVGLSGVAGSVGWFTAMTLQQVAYVRALAQIELIFTLAVSWFIFKERLSVYELIGCGLIGVSLVGIVLAAG